MRTEQTVSGGLVSFPEEERHLEQIQAQLNAALLAADHSVGFLDQEYQDAKRYMVEHRGDIDPHEMFQSGCVLRQIDRSGALAVEVRERIQKMKESPYFARIDFRMDGEEESAVHYIGRFAFVHEDALLILDWRAPMAHVFYECEVGPAHYIAPQGCVEGELTRKRQFRIQGGIMEYALETSTNVQDEVLQRELSLTSDEKMKSIIATLQREQNAVIRNEKAKTLIIQGVAGSGKTSIALHRVAFLLYRFAGTLSARNVTILSPNRVFGDFISGVLPELGEEPLFEVSLREIADVQLERVMEFEPDRSSLEETDALWAERVRYKSTAAFLRQMDAFIAELPRFAFKALDYRYERFRVPAEWIQARVEAYVRYPLFRRLEMIADDLHDRLEGENIRGEELPKPRTLLKELKAMLEYKSTFALYQALYRYLGKPEMFQVQRKRTLEWNDVFPFLYLRAAYEGLRGSEVIRHLVIDEMQDYTPIQFAVLNRLFPCDKTILGDFGQAIHPHHRHTLDDLRQLYSEAEFVCLQKSYRSTREIIEFARSICPTTGIEAIERHGPEPVVIRCNDPGEELATLRRLIAEFRKSGNHSLGIIAKTHKHAKALHDRLSTDPEIHLIGPESRHFPQGVSIVSIHMAKGLEFDEVILPDTDSLLYATAYDAKLLYVACTRAMHKLTLLHTGEGAPCLEARR